MNEHQRAAIRDPHNAAYHEARGEIEELRAERDELRAEVDRLRAGIERCATTLQNLGHATPWRHARELRALIEHVG